MGITLQQYQDMLTRTSKNKLRECPAEDAEPREADLHEKIIEECRAHGWLFFHGSTAHRTKRTLGEPDFCCLLPGGVIIFVECKRKGGKLSIGQQGIAAWMRKLGHELHVVFSIQEFRVLCSEAMKGKGSAE